VYVFGNGGPEGNGTVSLCNVHSPDSETAYADYDPEVRQWRVIQDPARNQMQRMIDSPHLCPAMPGATGGRASDRVHTERGDLYHACRYLGCNQVPVDQHQFGRQAYDDAVTLYRAVAVAEAALAGTRQPEPYLARVRRITTGVSRLWDRAVVVLRDAVDAAALDLGLLPAAGLPVDLVDAVRSAEPVHVAEVGSGTSAGHTHVIPLPFPVWSVGGKLDEPARVCGGCP
jgi:hypothetical protein